MPYLTLKILNQFNGVASVIMSNNLIKNNHLFSLLFVFNSSHNLLNINEDSLIMSLANFIQGMLLNSMSQNQNGLNNLGNIVGSALGNNTNNNGLGNILGQLAGGMGGMGQTGGLGNILGGALGDLGGNLSDNGMQNNLAGINSQSKLLFILVPFILAWIERQGGFKAALDQLTHAGMGQQVNSWVSQGDNASVSAEHMATVFPPEQVQQLASQAGTDTNTIYQNIANLLPQMVNAITPNGQATGNGSSQQIAQVMNLFK